MENEFRPARLHPLLAGRSSPASFDPGYDATADEIDALLEAARWAPSAGNSQPWAFIVGQRGDPAHERLVRHLAGSSARWAPSASLLIANLSHRYVEDTDWEFSEFSLYDLGPAGAAPRGRIRPSATGSRAAWCLVIQPPVTGCPAAGCPAAGCPCAAAPGPGRHLVAGRLRPGRRISPWSWRRRSPHG